jgi:hypothetical protein
VVSHRSNCSENVQETQRIGQKHTAVDSSTINALAREKSLGRGREWDSQLNAIADENVIPNHNRSISLSRADDSFLINYNAQLIGMAGKSNNTSTKAQLRAVSENRHVANSVKPKVASINLSKLVVKGSDK